MKKITQLLVIFIISIFATIYASWLNEIYYAKFGPFYDSLSYHGYMAKIMQGARDYGVLASISAGMHNQTVLLPWIESSLLGAILTPSRWNGVLIQFPYLLILLYSAYFYFIKVGRFSSTISAFLSLSIISFGSFFHYSGGYPDLRMDLSQALLFGASIATFLTAQYQEKLKPWIIFGLIVALACLVRATTPIYALLSFGLVAIFNLCIYEKHRTDLLKKYFLVFLLVCVISGWFFIMNFDYLKFYYLVWNGDSTAKLPIKESIKHLDYVKMHLGNPAIVFIAFIFIAEIILAIRKNAHKKFQFNWRALYIAIIPISILILSGAGLNNYVSLIALPGILLFAITPIVYLEDVKRPVILLRGYVFAIIFLGSYSIYSGYQSIPKVPLPYLINMQAVNGLINEIEADTKTRGIQRAVIEVTYVGGMHSGVFANSLIFDHQYKFKADGYQKGNLWIGTMSPGLAQPQEWKSIAGVTDEEKIKTLIKEAVLGADYLVVPEEGTEIIGHLPISPYAFMFRDELIKTGHFVKIYGPIQVASNEIVSLYAKK
jgi:hypothetical protein